MRLAEEERIFACSFSHFHLRLPKVMKLYKHFIVEIKGGHPLVGLLFFFVFF